jgi:hypothetical protein
MNIEPVLAGLLRFGEDEWIGLWVIADDVAQDLGVEDWAENLEATLALVRELLRRGYRAGDSPLENDAVHSHLGPTRMPRPSSISSDGNGYAERTYLPGVTLPGSPPRDSAAPMAELGLLGWLASAPETTTPRLFALGVGGMIVLGMGIYMLHRHIERRIREIRSL